MSCEHTHANRDAPVTFEVVLVWAPPRFIGKESTCSEGRNWDTGWSWSEYPWRKICNPTCSSLEKPMREACGHNPKGSQSQTQLITAGQHGSICMVSVRVWRIIFASCCCESGLLLSKLWQSFYYKSVQNFIWQYLKAFFFSPALPASSPSSWVWFLQPHGL